MSEVFPMILSLGDSDYVTIYNYEIESKNLKLDYRYTGEKSFAMVDSILAKLVKKAFTEMLKEPADD